MATFEGRFSDAAGLRVGIVVARFNDLVTAKLLSGCLDCLKRHGVDVSETSSQLDVAWVPGSFELPIVAQQMARSGQYQVLITLGAVIRGDTPHFDVVVAEASKGVAAVARDTSVPVIFGVLTTDTMQQALERAGIKSNLGWSYGLEALEMGSLMKACPLRNRRDREGWKRVPTALTDLAGLIGIVAAIALRLSISARSCLGQDRWSPNEVLRDFIGLDRDDEPVRKDWLQADVNRQFPCKSHRAWV